MTDGRITVLVENTAGRRGLLGEHGLSFWIELEGKKILFDTGQGHVLTHNAQQLGIRLDQVDAIVLSHGHYDHTGGLAEVLKAARRPLVYTHPAAFGSKYAQNRDGTARDVGMPEIDEPEVRRHAELVWVENPMEIPPGLHLTGPVPRVTSYEDTGGGFFQDPECTTPDELLDDQAVFMETPAGTVVLLGCAHAGIVNTLQYIQWLTHGRPIHTVMGGTHLINAGPERMEETIAALRRLEVSRLFPCHCTGFTAAARLWSEFPTRCAGCPTGTVVEIPE
jgi:7,8-dihydropterin-6-yl-methyl-4-(beta-D-ribofuranosyl)aminobenzene 5'-phosphate synthase